MFTLTFDALNEKDTIRFGTALADLLPPGTTVSLCGTLGAGKTRLVQAIAEALGIDRRDVLSPTFVLVQEHQGRRPLRHIDAYRVRDDDEFMALGAEEFFDPHSDGLTLVEWGDRVQACLPDERVEVHIEVTGAGSRRFLVVAIGDRYATAMAGLQQSLDRQNTTA